MTTDVNPPARFVFGDHELDVARVQLLRRGAAVPIQRKPLFLLMYLLGNPDRTVPNSELVREVWKGVSVTEASLRRAIRVLRQTLGNDGTYIESVRGFGYRFAAPVERVSTPPANPLVRAAREDIFVGRDQELAALDRALEQGPGFALVAGAAGMGKTRLVQELADRAESRGVGVTFGQCWDGGGSPAFWPWGPMLSELGGSSDETLGATLELEGAPTRFRLFADVKGALQRAVRAQPQLFIFEDVHWAEEPSLQEAARVRLRTGPTV